MVAHAYNHNTEQSCHEFRISLCHIVSSRLAWATKWDCVSKKQKQNKANPKKFSKRPTKIPRWNGPVVAHAFNPSTWEAEAGGSLSSRTAWSTEWVPGQPGLHRQTLSQQTKRKKKERKKERKKETKKQRKKETKCVLIYLWISSSYVAQASPVQIFFFSCSACLWGLLPPSANLGFVLEASSICTTLIWA